MDLEILNSLLLKNNNAPCTFPNVRKTIFLVLLIFDENDLFWRKQAKNIRTFFLKHEECRFGVGFYWQLLGVVKTTV